MREIPLTDAAGRLDEVVRHAVEQRTPVWLTEDGHRVAAVVDAASLQGLDRMSREEGDREGGPFSDADRGDLGL